MQKLVRDKIPDKIRANGENPNIRIADPAERLILLMDKLTEESNELKGAILGKSKMEIMEEMGDVIEVLNTIRTIYEIDEKQLKEIQTNKAQKNGRFENGIVLISTSREV